MVSEDHLLARTPGDYIAKALLTPPPAKDSDDGAITETVIDVPGVVP